MERRIYMSNKELDRLGELKKVHEKRQTAIQAAVNLGLSRRQVLRLSRRLKLEGPEGLVSKKVGARGNHRLPDEVKNRALELILATYRDFGPTLAHEYLTERDGLYANTPQAKGRVERRNRDLQDRLIKAMRLINICSTDEANAFLPTFIEDFNRRFGKPAQDTTNAHRPLLGSHDLNRILCFKHERRLSKSLSLQYNNVIYQIITDRPSYTMRKSGVIVLESIEGVVSIEYNGKPLRAVPYHEVQERAEVVSAKELASVLEVKQTRRHHPGKRHPWKRWRGPTELAAVNF